MSKSKKPVYGIGINDADYPLFITGIAGGRRKNLWICPFYRAWTGMLERCYSAKFHKRNPNYQGCSVAPEWLSFSSFRSWMTQQNYEGMQLDKDILFSGNRVYSADTCVFVPPDLNKFVIDSAASRGEWPEGVNWHKARGKFVAQCRNPFTQKKDFLGYFSSHEPAHEAWRKQKHLHALAYAELQDDPRIAAALRGRYLATSSAKT